MAFEADRVVVELIAKVDQFDQPVKASSTSFDASMNKIAASATKAEQAVVRSSSGRAKALERESAQIGQFSRLLGNQLNDVGNLLSSPRSPFVVPAREAPKVANAMKLVQVGGAAMAGVLGGVAVTAAFALAEALIALVTSGNDTNAMIADMVEKLKENAEKTDLAKRAQAVFEMTLEGVTQALNDNEKALASLNAEERTAAEQALFMAERYKIRLQQIRDETQALIDQARARSALTIITPGSSGAGQAVAETQALAQLDALERKLKTTDVKIQQAERQITEAVSFAAVELSKTQATEIGKIDAKYNRLIKQARERAIAEGTVRTTLKAQTDELERQREAEKKLARERARNTKDPNQQSGRQITDAEARRIATQDLGLPARAVTSQTRSAADNRRVGGVANSLHLTGQAIDIDKKLATAAGLTLGKIVKAFEAKGVRVIEKLDEGDHFHLGFAKRGSGARGPSEETLAKRAAAEAERAANRAQAYDNEKASLEDQVIDARQALVTSAEEIAKLELTAIDLARAKYADQVAHLQSIGKLQDGEAAELLKLNEERAKLRAEAVKRREDERKFRMREAEIQRSQTVQLGGLQAQGDLLQSQDGIAKTQRERAIIAQRLLDLQFAEERLMLQAAIDRETRLKAEYARTQSAQILAELQQAEVDAALARQQLATIDQRQSNANTVGSRENASPLQSYFGDIQAQADDLNTAFEMIAAGGLQNFEDKLTDAIVNFRSLGDVGRAVLAGITADLVRLAIRLILNATIGKLVQSTAAAGAAASGTAVATAWAPAAAAVSLATFGANAVPANAAIAATNALAMGFAAAGGAGFAEGGRIYGPGSSTSDRVPIMASPDEFMIKARSARQIGYANLEAMNATGELPYAFARGGRIRPMNARASAPYGGNGGMSEDALRRIEAAVERGAAAQAPVNLFPTYDNEAAFQAALNTPGGRRAMFKFFNDNPGAIGNALGR